MAVIEVYYRIKRVFVDFVDFLVLREVFIVIFILGLILFLLLD